MRKHLKPNISRANRDAEAAARACLVRYGAVRLFLSRLFENLLRPILHFAGKDARETLEEPQSILVVEYWNLGDFVMLTPFLKNLRLHYPKAHIALLASPRIVPMAQEQELVDEIIPVTVPWAQHMSRRRKYVSRHWVSLFRCIRLLRARRFDLGFTARADVRENFLLWAGGVARRVGYGFAHGGALLTEVVPPDLSRPHYVDRWLHLLEHLKKPILDRRPQLRLGPEQRAFAKSFLKKIGIEHGETVIGFHSGARNKVRQWGEEKFLEVARRLKDLFPVKILWFRDQGESEVPTDSGIIPVGLPLEKFLAVLSECRMLVCNDTGPMHMASGLGVPVVAIFGPTQPEWFGPVGESHRIVIRREMWCRPCFDYCIFDQPYCLRVVTADSVYEAAEEALRTLLNGAELSKRTNGGSPERLKMISGAERAAD
jgi:ADP-heptose:LPS heptosyltransferase